MTDTPKNPPVNRNSSGSERDSSLLRLVLVLPFWAAIAHSIRNRSLHDYFVYSSFLAAAIAVIVLATFVLEWRRDGIRKLSKQEVLLVCTSPVWLLLFGAFFYSLGAAIADVVAYIFSAALTPTGSVVAASLITLIAGAILWWFRLRRRIFYGLSEAVVGLTVAATRFAAEGQSASKDPAFYLAMLTAGVYLVVRGFDNIHQGLKERRAEQSRSSVTSQDDAAHQ